MKQIINRVPLLKAFLPFLFGILLAVSIEIIVPYALPLIVLFLIVYLVIEGFIKQYLFKRSVTFFLFGAIFFLIGNMIVEKASANKKHDFYGHHIEKGTHAIVKLTEPPVQKARSIKAKVAVQQVQVEGKWIATSGESIIYFRNSEEALGLYYGDVLQVKQDFRDIPLPKNPGEFNYNRYLRFHQIFHQAFLKPEDWQILQRDRGNYFMAAVYKSRSYFSKTLKEKIEDKQALGVTSALLLGQRDLLDRETIKAYSGTGAMHVLAVSGLHVGIIYLLLNKLFSFLNRKKKVKRFIKPFLILICIWLYASITGLSPSVMRAATMFSFLAIAKVSNRPGNIYGSIVASAFLLLIIDPFIITQVGFMLSYLAVIGIIALQPHIERMVYLPNPILKKVWQITSVSIAAQIATFPLGLFFFYQFPTYFLISNLIVIPAAMVILVTGILLFIVSPIAVAADLVGSVLSFLVVSLNNILKSIQQLPFSIWQGVSISVFETVLIYGIIISTTAFFLNKQTRLLYAPLILFIMLFSSIGYGSFNNSKSMELVVYNVPGQKAIGLIKGKEIIFFADRSLVEDEDKMLFHIRHHWWNKDLNRINYSDPINEGKVMELRNYKVGFVTGINDLETVDKEVRYLILQKNILDYSGLIAYTKLEKVILDANLYPVESKALKEKLALMNLSVHDVAVDGAYVLKN